MFQNPPSASLYEFESRLRYFLRLPPFDLFQTLKIMATYSVERDGSIFRFSIDERLPTGDGRYYFDCRVHQTFSCG